jgi:rhodanese-related sulfurtransferase
LLINLVGERRALMKIPKVILLCLFFSLLPCIFPFVGATQQAATYTVITAENLKNLQDSGKECLIVDTLPQKSYTREHLPGAKHFEFPNQTMKDWNSWKTGGRTQDEFAAFLGADKERPVVFYCLDER